MSDLTDFLLDRIAEDEAAALNADLHTERARRKAEASSWELLVADESWVTENTGGLPLITVSEERVRAECEAKRRIVAAHSYPAGECSWTVDDGSHGPTCETLQALALPYADHHDYRAEWAA